MFKKRKWMIGLLLLSCLLPICAAAASPPSQAGEKKLEGGQRDFLYPCPGAYNLSSCFLDRREHYSLDFAGAMGTSVIASYDGTVIQIYDSCTHNYGKKTECCSSWGNFVLMRHNYVLESGEKITLYSRYAHLGKVLVSEGQTVSAGKKIGTLGSTGHSTGPHLDYEILWGGTSPSKTYGVDPYINQLLELPEELYTTFGSCCQEYVAYIKEIYPHCPHSAFNSQGKCTACGYAFAWKDTRDASVMGYYTASSAVAVQSIPYPTGGSAGVTLSPSDSVSVSGKVTNGLGQVYYELTLQNGNKGYVPKSCLTFHSYLASSITGSLSTLEEGQVLASGSHPLGGTVQSLYPLQTLRGYLDGELYATWTGWAQEVNLRNTALNQKLNFASVAPGTHTLTITAEDSTGRMVVEVIHCNFTIQGASPETPTTVPAATTPATQPQPTIPEPTQPQESVTAPEEPAQTEDVSFLFWLIPLLFILCVVLAYGGLWFYRLYKVGAFSKEKSRV